ncbi:MAG: hypothetical protein ACN6PK_17035 [Pseudomonas shirazensis]
MLKKISAARLRDSKVEAPCQNGQGFCGGCMTAKRPGLLQARRPIAKSVLTERDRSSPFDENYYDGLGTFASGSCGEPRNAVVNAKWRF